MRVQSLVSWIVAVGALTSWSSRAAVGQQLALAARTPRFFYSPTAAAKPLAIDVSRNAVLRRVVSLHVKHASIGGLLADIQRQTGLTFAYDPHFPTSRAVTLEADSISVAAALGAILIGAGVDVVLTPTGHVWLTESNPPPRSIQEGAILGRVTDKRTNGPIADATVTLDPGHQIATTGSDGRYRFASLVPGSYTVRARYIGYASLAASVAVRAEEEATIDFPLEKSAQPLEQVVVTGTLVPTAVKALPTPVTVISEEDIALQRPRTLQELFRQAVPGAVSWDNTARPADVSFSVRGASTLNPGLTQMKVFVDGVEQVYSADGAVDPTSIERIEVIRGPQAASIYGSDAIGGVVQIFTKKGDQSLGRPQIDAEAALGIIQTPYAGYGEVLRQSYSGSVRGGTPDVSYNVGGSYSHVGDWLPNGEQSSQSNPSVYGGMRFARGSMTVDLSGRYHAQNNPDVVNPEYLQTGSVFFSKPLYTRAQWTNQTVGLRLGLSPRRWWHHTLTLGIDRFLLDKTQSQQRLTTAADTLLSVTNTTFSKRLIGYTSSMQAALGSDVSGVLTAGVDHYDLPQTSFRSSGTVATTGTIGGSVRAYRLYTKNTGYFSQVQLGLRDALFLTGGLRLEENTNFGDSLGTPMSPRLGVSYVQNLGGSTLKLRGAWGRAIRAPDPALKLSSGPSVIPNLTLGPERQEGWDVGLDAAFGTRGSVSVTYYDQSAENLIQFVLVQSTPVPLNQFQNVGRVRNTGVEVEGALSLGLLQLKANYAYTRARIDALASNYTGDLQVGDQVPVTPKHTAGALLVITPTRGTTVTTGAAYVGRYRQTDFVALLRCGGGTGPCPSSFMVEYRSFVKVNATLWQQIMPQLSGFASVDNLTNNHANELGNGAPLMGRISTVGFRFQY